MANHEQATRDYSLLPSMNNPRPTVLRTAHKPSAPTHLRLTASGLHEKARLRFKTSAPPFGATEPSKVRHRVFWIENSRRKSTFPCRKRFTISQDAPFQARTLQCRNFMLPPVQLVAHGHQRVSQEVLTLPFCGVEPRLVAHRKPYSPNAILNGAFGQQGTAGRP